VRLCFFVALKLPVDLTCAVQRFGVKLNLFFGQVDAPRFLDARLRVERNLIAAVALNRRIGHFDDEQHIGGRRMRVALKVVAPAQERNIGLRL
jgi:hypothetical protein